MSTLDDRSLLRHALGMPTVSGTRVTSGAAIEGGDPRWPRLSGTRIRVGLDPLVGLVGNIAIDAAIGGIPVLGEPRMPKSHWVIACLLLMAALACAALSIGPLHTWLEARDE